MARVIALDASALIAQFNDDDAHHARIGGLLGELTDERLVVSVVNAAEALVPLVAAGRVREGWSTLGELGIDPVGLSDSAIADLARISAETGLRLPDCCLLHAAQVAGADAVLTFDAGQARAAVARGLADLAGAAGSDRPDAGSGAAATAMPVDAAVSPVDVASLSAGATIEQLFCELVAIPSPSGRERAVGDAIAAWLVGAGVADVGFDAAGAVNDSDAGNLIARVPGDPGAPTLLFVAHMDTVETGADPVRPTIDSDGVIRSAGDTILGADNKSAVAAVMRLCAAVASMPSRGRPTVVAAFTCREESGRMGASLLSDAALAVDCAFSVDGSRPIGTVITRALGQQVFTIELRGRAAHAAADPDAGVSAIAVASEIVTSLGLGRQPGGGSASIASIVGGAVIDKLDAGSIVGAALEASPTNSIPDRVLLRGELRAYSGAELRSLRSELEAVVRRVCEARDASYQWRDRERAVPPFPGADDSRALALARAAAADVGVPVIATETHATLEANYMAASTDVVALASGGSDPHSHTESITVSELEQLDALLTRIVELAGGA